MEGSISIHYLVGVQHPPCCDHLLVIIGKMIIHAAQRCSAPITTTSPRLGLDLRLPGAQQQDVGGPKRWPKGKITSDKIWESCHVKIPPTCHAGKNVHFKPGNTTWLANQKDWPK